MELRDAWPALPDDFDDREQDAWEPWLAIADMARHGWGGRARSAAVALAQDRGSEESVRILLFAHIRDAFDGRTPIRAPRANALAERFFDEVFRTEGVKTVETPVRAPRATRSPSDGSERSAPNARTAFWSSAAAWAGASDLHRPLQRQKAPTEVSRPEDAGSAARSTFPAR